MLPHIVLVIILARGWTETGMALRSLLAVLLGEIPGVKVFTVEYLDAKGEKARFHSHLTVEKYAEKVKEMYLYVQENYPGVRILLVGHSLGGVLIRYLCSMGLFSSRNMILIGTPNKGITYRSFGLVKFIIFWIASLKQFCDVPVFRQILKGSSFLEKMNAKRIPSDSIYIVGDDDMTVSRESSDPYGMGIVVKCNHHLIPFDGRDYNSLTEEELVVLKNSAIPEILRIVKKIVQEA